MKISYECSDLIEELQDDMEEFGDIDMYAFFEKVEGFTFLTNYDFIEDEKTLESKELEDGTIVQVMKASKILEILKNQDEVL